MQNTVMIFWYIPKSKISNLYALIYQIMYQCYIINVAIYNVQLYPNKIVFKERK